MNKIKISISDGNDINLTPIIYTHVSKTALLTIINALADSYKSSSTENNTRNGYDFIESHDELVKFITDNIKE